MSEHLADAEPGNRFEKLEKHEAALLCFGITMVVAELTHGAITGEPAPAETVAHDLPLLAGMMNELAAALGVDKRLDPDILAATFAVLDQEAARERDERQDTS